MEDGGWQGGAQRNSTPINSDKSRVDREQADATWGLGKREDGGWKIEDGNPAETRTINKIALERNGVSTAAQAALRQAFKIFYRGGLTIPNALAQIEAELPPLPEIQHFVRFIRASERGVTR